jgi:hypothetical protein
MKLSTYILNKSNLIAILFIKKVYSTLYKILNFILLSIYLILLSIYFNLLGFIYVFIFLCFISKI